MGKARVRWRLTVFRSRWRDRIRYVLNAPRVYQNWWAMPLPKLGIDTVLRLRNGTRYHVRGGTLDLSVVNEQAFSNPYLGSGFITLNADSPPSPCCPGSGRLRWNFIASVAGRPKSS